MLEQNTLSTPTTSDCGKVATERTTLHTDIVQSAEKPPIVTVLLPGLRIPSLNELLRMHYGRRAALSNRYHRLLANCAFDLREAISQSRLTAIILSEDASCSGMKSPESTDATMQNRPASLGSMNRKKARFTKWKFGKRGRR